VVVLPILEQHVPDVGRGADRIDGGPIDGGAINIRKLSELLAQPIQKLAFAVVGNGRPAEEITGEHSTLFQARTNRECYPTLH
jgi:hypothetical protein